MKRGQAVKRYAKIFFNSAGIDSVPEALEELTTISRIMEKSGEFRGLLENPLFTAAEREKVMKDLSGRLKISGGTVRFILYLTEQMAVSSLSELIQVITALYLEKKKKAKAVVMTSVEMNGTYEERLRSSLKHLTGRDADIEYVIDPSLLGGIVVKVGSTMYDSSLKGQLRLLKDELIKG